MTISNFNTGDYVVSLHTDMSCVSVTQSVVIRASIVFVTQLFSARLQSREPMDTGWGGVGR